MQIEFHCPCGFEIWTPADMAGRSGRCPVCREWVNVPGDEPAAPVLTAVEEEPPARELPEPEPRPEAIPARRKPCPRCGVAVLAEARRCPYCNLSFEPIQASAPARRRALPKAAAATPLGTYSLVSGFASLFCARLLFGPLAIVFGIMGLWRKGEEGASASGVILGAIGTVMGIVELID